MGQRVAALSTGRTYDFSSNQWTCHGRAQQVLATVDRAGPERWPDEVFNELAADIHDMTGNGSRCPGTLFNLVQVFSTLTYVDDDTHDFRAVCLLDPRHGNRGVQATGECQRHLVHR